MIAVEVIRRALKAAGQPSKYRLGGGVLSPVGDSPLGEDGSCDCSAFACWALGIKKHQPGLSWLRKVNGGWYNTDGIYHDALFEQTGSFYSVAMNEAQDADVIVYPSAQYLRHAPKHYQVGSRAIGHVGILVRRDADKVLGAFDVIHCSAGNFRQTGKAICRTAVLPTFSPAATKIVRCAYVG